VPTGDRARTGAELADASGKLLDPIINRVPAGRPAGTSEIGTGGSGSPNYPVSRIFGSGKKPSISINRALDWHRRMVVASFASRRANRRVMNREANGGHNIA
jgi:hypothetical protein